MADMMLIMRQVQQHSGYAMSRVVASIFTAR